MLQGELHKLGPFASVGCGIITLVVLTLIFSSQNQASTNAAQTANWARCIGTVNSTYKERNQSTYVCYDYSVGGKKYSGQKVYFDQFGSGASIPDSEKYTVGQTVPVFYDAQKPESAVLKTGTDPHKNYFAYGMGVIFALGLIFAGIVRLNRPM